jgi:hypothetical protein
VWLSGEAGFQKSLRDSGMTVPSLRNSGMTVPSLRDPGMTAGFFFGGLAR